MNSLKQTISRYYNLTKPGIVYGNLITGAAGFCLAQHGHFYLGLFAEFLAGLGLVVASSCVFNNYLDKGIDQKMARTQKRALVSGAVSGQAALIYASVLSITGYIFLSFTTAAAVAVVALAQILYIFVYGWAKRHTVYSTIIGSLPGAVPPAAGYLAVSGKIDSAVVILFLILVFWQLPHFYAIGLYRRAEYKAAGLPILPAVISQAAVKRQIMGYILAFTATAICLSIFGYTGYIYLAGALIVGLGWLSIGAKYYHRLSAPKWGKKMFLTSLAANLCIAVLIAFGWALP